MRDTGRNPQIPDDNEPLVASPAFGHSPQASAFIDDAIQHQLELLAYRLRFDDSLQLLIGAPGSGRSSLLAQLADKEPDSLLVVELPGTDSGDPINGVRQLLESLDQSLPDNERDLQTALHQQLAARAERGLGTVLALDDADQLDDPSLQHWLDWWQDLQQSMPDTLRLLLVGEEALIARASALLAAGSPPAALSRLRPLGIGRARAFLAHHLDAPEDADFPFSATALGDLYRDSGGLPGPLLAAADAQLNGAPSQPQMTWRQRLEAFAARFKKSRDKSDESGTPEAATAGWAAALRQRLPSFAAIEALKSRLPALAIDLPAWLPTWVRDHRVLLGGALVLLSLPMFLLDSPEPEPLGPVVKSLPISLPAKRDEPMLTTGNKLPAEQKSIDAIPAPQAVPPQQASPPTPAAKPATTTAAQIKRAAPPAATEPSPPVSKPAAPDIEPVAPLSPPFGLLRPDSKTARADTPSSTQPAATSTKKPVAKPEPKPAPAKATNASDHDWLLAQAAERYSLQLIAAAKHAALDEFTRRYRLSGELRRFSIRRGQQTLHVLLYGLFADQAGARRALADLPSAVRQQRPWIRSLGSIQQAIREGGR